MRALLLSALLMAQPVFANVKVIVSVDWEGEDLSHENLKAFSKFREDYPEIPLMQFLNAAYFTKKDANPNTIRRKINSVLRPGDEHGLHIHAWKSLFEASGVKYHASPNWDDDTPQNDCSYDCGHGVPISTYSYDELRKVISYSVQTLTKHGYKTPRSFRAGGWMSAPHVLEALAEEGFLYDNSALPAHFLNVSRAKYIKSWVEKLWPGITDLSQPYRISFRNSSIVEIPDNGCLADYVTSKQVLEGFEKITKLWKENKEGTYYYSIGFHQETANSWLPRFRKGIDLIKKYAEENSVDFEFVNYPLEIMN